MGNSRAATLTACVNNPHSSAIKGGRGSLNHCKTQTGLQSQCFLWMQRQTHACCQSVSSNLSNTQAQEMHLFHSSPLLTCLILVFVLFIFSFWFPPRSQVKACKKESRGSKYEKYWRGEKWKEQSLTQSPEDCGSSRSVYPCKAKSLERALRSKSSALYTTPALC